MILAIALIGLICLGLLGLGTVFFFTTSARDQAQALTTPVPPTPIPPSPTSTATATGTPTETPTSTPTNTPVIDLSGDTEQAPVDTPTTDPNATATNTRVLETQTTTPDPTSTPTAPPEVIPDSGGVLPLASNNSLVWVGSGLLLVLIIYGMFHRFRLFQDSDI